MPPPPPTSTPAKSLVKCDKCEKDIMEGTVLETAGKSYHPACFVCGNCETPISGSFFPRTDSDGNSYAICTECRKAELPASNCALCDGVVAGGPEDIVHGNRVFHKKCFCCSCGNPIKPGESFRLKNENNKIVLQCKQCIDKNAKICSQCTKPIAPGARYVHSQEKYWHEDCFICNKCKQIIKDGTFCPSNDGGIMCKACAN